MSLAPGVRLGAYEVIVAIDNGGMGSARGCGERVNRVEPPLVGVGPHEQLNDADPVDFAPWPC
jgi:hypothetical protein